MASTYELIIKATDQTGQPLRKIETSLNVVDKQTKKTNVQVRKLLKSFKSIGSSAVTKSFGAVSKGLTGVAAAGTVAAGTFVVLAKQTLDYLDSIDKVSSKLGVTAQFLTAYGRVAKEVGIEQDTFNVGIQRFLRRLGQAQQGTGELLKPLQRMGINMKDTNGNFREGTDVFGEFIRKMGDMTVQEQKLATAMAAFDTEGVDFVNIANLGADAIDQIIIKAKEAGIVLSQDMVKGAADANDAIAELFDFGRGLKIQFFDALAPDIKKAADYLRDQINEKIKASGGIQAVTKELAASFLKGVAQFTEFMAKAIDTMVNGFAVGVNTMQKLIVGLSPVLDGVFKFGNLDQIKKDFADVRQEIIKLKTEKGFANILPTYEGDLTDKLKDVADFTVKLSFIEQTRLNNLRAKYKELQNDIEAAGKGELTFFKQLETNTTTSVDATQGLTSALRESAKALEDQAAADRKAFETKGVTAELNETIKEQTVELTDAQIKLNAAAKAYSENILQPNAKVLEQIQKQKDDLAILIERYLHLDEQASSTGNNASIAMKNMRKEIVAAQLALGEVTDLFAKDIAVTASDSIVLVNNKIKALQTELAAVNKTGEMFKAFIDPEKQTAQVVALTKEIERLKVARDQLLGVEKKDPVKEDANSYESLLKRQRETIATTKKLEGNLKTLNAEFADNQSAEIYKMALEDLANNGIQAAADKLRELKYGNDELTATILETWEDVSKTLPDTLARGLLEGKNALESFKNVFNQILDDIALAIIKKNITQPLVDGISGMFSAGASSAGGSSFFSDIGSSIMGFFGGGKANGGPVIKGRSYLVGERGPEMFMPKTNGQIVPNEALNSDGGGTTVQFVLNAIDTQTGTEFLLQNKDKIVGMVTQAQNQRGRVGIMG